MIKKYRYIVEYIFFQAASFLFRILPHAVYSSIGSMLGTVAYKWFNVRREIMRVQLDIAEPLLQKRLFLQNPDMLAQRIMANIGKSSAEFLARPGAGFFLNNRLFSISGKERLDRVRLEGKGGVIVTGHFGNWEWMGALAAKEGIEITYLVADLHNPYITKAVNKTRKKWGIDVINQKTGLLKAVRRLENGDFLAVLADQDAGKRGLFVPFFDIPASTTKLPAFLSSRTGAPILPVFMISHEGNYRIHFENAIYPERDDDIDRTTRKLTEAFTAVIENYVKEYPELWFWPHRRWKTKPPGSKTVVSYAGLSRKATLKRREK